MNRVEQMKIIQTEALELFTRLWRCVREIRCNRGVDAN